VLNPVGFTLSTCSTLSTLVSPLIELSSKHQNSQESFQFGADNSTPPGSERERGKRERARDDADRRGPHVRGGRARGAGLAGPKWLFPFPGSF
jgi:hypothetical protein